MITRVCPILAATLAVALLAVAGGVWFASASPGKFHSDLEFAGIRDSLNKGNNVHLVIIHGIGTHCVGYSQQLVNGILESSHMEPGTASIGNCADVDIKDVTSSGEAAKCLMTKGCEIIFLSQDVPPDSVDHHYCANYDPNIGVLKPVGEGDRQRCIYRRIAGFVRTDEYTDRGTGRSVRTYEVTWDPATRWFKTDYVDLTDRTYDGNRSEFNRGLKKELVNQSIADAVLYLGGYKRAMQYPLLMSLCKVAGYGSDVGKIKEVELGPDGSPPPSNFICNPEQILQAENSVADFTRDNDVVLITHSLGTRMLFDTLGLIGSKGKALFGTIVEDLKIPYDVVYGIKNTEDAKNIWTLSQSSQKLQDIFSKSVRKIFTFANQVPLLELGEVKSAVDYVQVRAASNDRQKANLGSGFGKFLDRRESLGVKQPLQVVSFTDENDLLSYNLKCWYYVNVLRYQHQIGGKKGAAECEPDVAKPYWDKVESSIRMAEVVITLSDYSIASYFSEPLSAHTGYFEQDNVFKLVACGGRKGNEFNRCDPVVEQASGGTSGSNLAQVVN